MAEQEPPTFDTPFDQRDPMPPYDEHWVQRRALNERLKNLALQLVTRDASLEQLVALDQQLAVAEQQLVSNRELCGRNAWVADEQKDHGSYRTLSREITPISGHSHVMAPPMHTWFDRDNNTAHAEVNLNWLYEGPPGCVHGGIVAALFDDFLGCAQLLTGQAGATGSLQIHYHRPTPLNTALSFTGWVEEQRGRKMILRGEVYANGKLTAAAEGLFVVLERGVINLAQREK